MCPLRVGAGKIQSLADWSFAHLQDSLNPLAGGNAAARTLSFAFMDVDQSITEVLPFEPKALFWPAAHNRSGWWLVATLRSR